VFWELLRAHFIHTSLIAGVVVSAIAGLIGPIVVARRMGFAVHGIAELGLTGAAGGLLIGLDATTGALIGSVAVGAALGLLGLEGRERDSTTGVVLAAGLGLGVLFLSLYQGYATAGFGLLFGSVTTVSDAQLRVLLLVAGVVAAVLAVIWRPLWFASVDPDAAVARGVPTRVLAVIFAVLMGAVVAETIQVTGVLLILTLVITPAAAAQLMTARPGATIALSVAIAVTVTTGGILSSIAKPWPPTFFISMYSFLIYAATRLHRAAKAR
jgi:zinc/manganese transport system permease protein